MKKKGNMKMSKKTITLKTPLITEEVEISIHTYANNGNLCVSLSSRDEYGNAEPFADATVNLDVKLPAFQAYIKNYSENEGFLDFMTANGFGITLGKVHQGFSEYTLLVFDEARLREFDEDGVDRYMKGACS